MKKSQSHLLACKTLISPKVFNKIRYIAFIAFLVLMAQIGFGQDDPDKPDFIKSKISVEEFMKLRADAIGMQRGIEKDKPFNPANRLAAIRQMQEQKHRLSSGRNASQLNTLLTLWTELGPNPIPNGQVVSGPQLSVSGRTVSIAVHPTNPDIVYVGTAQGGLYRTLDGGTTWTPMLDNALSLAIGTVAIAPSQPNTIFVGTGESAFSADAFFGVGIYRIDNANSATPTITGPIGGSFFTGRAISKIVVHPTNPNIIFAASSSGIGGIGGNQNTVLADRGLFRSTDALSASPTFTQITITGLAAQNRNIVDIVMDPGNPNLVLCTEGDSFSLGEGGVYRSTDALAATPTFVRTFIAGVGTTASRTELALHRSGTGVITVYAASGFNGGTVQRSIDGGATWTQQIDNNFCGAQCFYNIAIDVDPSNADRVYLGGTGTTTTFGISINGGTSFTNSQSGLHTDSHVITVAPSLPSTIYFGSDGGIYKSTDAGVSWASMNNSTFRATQFMSLAVHPIDPNFTIGGTQDNGTNFYKPDGTWFRADFGDGGYSIIDQGATDNVNVNMYHTYFNASTLQGYGFVSTTASATEGGWVFRGCNGAGGNGIPCGGAVLFYAPIEQGPGTPNTVYYGANILYRSSDRGLNHTAVSQNLTNPISAIGISPQNDDVRIVGQNSGGLFGTTTGSTTLTNLDAANVVPNNFIARAVIDPNNVNTAYVTLSAFGVANVWKTTNLNNAAPTWTSAASGIPLVPVNAFVVDPTNSNNLFAGTDIGVYASTDAGASWVPFGTGLPVVAVFDMAIQPVSRVLRIATHGRGLWQNSISAPTPVITAGSVTGIISACFGTASASPNIQQFSVSGSNLTADIAVNAPANFHVSTLAGSGYGTSVNLTQAGGIVASTTIFVRSTASAPSGPIAGNVSLTSTGATTADVAVSGTIYPIPATPTITPAGPVTFCTGGSVMLNSSSATGNQWYLDGGVIAGATSQNYTALVAGGYTVKVTTDGCTSAASASITVTINLIPATATITPGGPFSFCTGGSVTLTSSSATGNQWYLDGNPIGGATAQAYVATASGNYTVIFTSLGCSSSPSASTTITVNPTPDVTQPANQVVCNGASTTTVTFSGSVPGTIFNWTNNTTSIGLAASGTGNIASFVATNVTSVPVVATVTVTPSFNSGSAAVPVTFSNATPILIPVGQPGATSGQSTPYPSNIVVSGITGPVTNVTIKLNNFNHTFPDDVDVLLVGPGGQNVIIMSDVGSTLDVFNVNLTLDDAAATNLPDATQIVSGTFRPTNIGAGDAFAAPAPAPAGGSLLSVFNGIDPNGTWSLYVMDDLGGDAGNLNGGWEITVTTGSAADITCNGTPKTFTYTVNPTPDAVATPSSQTICSGSAITTIVNTGNVSGTVFNWTRDNVATATGIAASGAGDISGTLTNTTGAPVTVTFTITPTANGCQGTAITATVLVNPTPTAMATPSAQTICSGATITTIVLSGSPVAGTVYNWTRNNVATVTGISASGAGDISGSLTNTTNAPVTVTFTITPTANDCTGTPITATVLVNPIPNVVATPSSQAVCSKVNITTIVLSGNVAGTTFDWTRDNAAVTGIASSGSGDISGALTNNSTVPVTVTFTITPKANGCYGSPVTATVTLNPLTVISVNPVSQTIFALNNTSFSVTATGTAPVTYQWQISIDAGATYSNLADGGVYSGTGTNTLSLTAVPYTMSGYKYQCVVTGGCTAATSTAATLAINRRPTVITYTGDASEQYSDRQLLTAVLKDQITNAPISGQPVTFTIGSQTSAAGTTNASGLGSSSIILLQNIGAYTVASNFAGNATYLPASDDDAFAITQENAIADYTGTQFVSVPCATCATTNLTLSATIRDTTAVYPLNDLLPGDIRTARVKFININTNTDLTGWLTPGLVNAADLKTGLVTATWTVPLPTTGYDTYSVGVIVDKTSAGVGNYIGRTETVINVSRSALGEFISGGGNIKSSQSAGSYASDPLTKLNFGFNIKYNRNNTNLQGNINIIFRRGGRVYQLKGTSINSLSINATNPCAKKATFTSKANLQDVTNPAAAIGVMGNLTLLCNITDKGEPGTSDSYSIKVTNSSNALIYSSNWVSPNTTELILNGGNIDVHNGVVCITTRNAMLVTEPVNTKSTEAFDAIAYPNPSSGQFNISVDSKSDEPISIRVVNSFGKVVYTHTNVAKTKQITLGDNFADGVYFAEVIQGTKRKMLRLVKGR